MFHSLLGLMANTICFNKVVLAEPKLEDLFQLNEGVSVVLQSVTPRAENVAFRTLK